LSPASGAVEAGTSDALMTGGAAVEPHRFVLLMLGGPLPGAKVPRRLGTESILR
jgi:hypothetical protein